MNLNDYLIKLPKSIVAALSQPPFMSMLGALSDEEATAKLEMLTHIFGVQKGSIVTLETRRPLKFLKNFTEQGYKGIKHSIFQCRVGAAYDNFAKVKEGRESGLLPEVNAGLSGREWIVSPFILKSHSTQKLLLRTYNVANNFIPKVSYMVNDKPAEKIHLEEYCLASEYREREDNGKQLCMDLPLDIIHKIHTKTV